MKLRQSDAFLGGSAIPFCGFGWIFLWPGAELIHQPKIKFRFRIASRGSPAIAFLRSRKVLIDTFAVGIHDTERDLGARVILRRRAFVILHRFAKVFQHTLTGLVEKTQAALRTSMTLRRRFLISFTCLFEIRFNASTVFVEEAKIGHGGCISIIRCLALALRRFFEVLNDFFANLVTQTQSRIYVCIAVFCTLLQLFQWRKVEAFDLFAIITTIRIAFLTSNFQCAGDCLKLAI